MYKLYVIEVDYLVVLVHITLIFRICKGSNMKVVCLLLHNF